VDLRLLDEEVATRRIRWEAAGVSWEILRWAKGDQPASDLRAESPGRAVQLIVWVSGEADLNRIEEASDLGTDHYELTSLFGLSECLDDVEEFLGVPR
jgi:hypothetical protein